MSVTNETKQTYGPDGAMFVPFIYLDLRGVWDAPTFLWLQEITILSHQCFYWQLLKLPLLYLNCGIFYRTYEEIFFFRPFVKNGTKNVIERLNFHIVTSLYSQIQISIDVMSMRGKFYGRFKVFNVLILGTNFQVHIFPQETNCLWTNAVPIC